MTDEPVTTPTPRPVSTARVLTTLMVPMFMALLALSVINVALPVIGTSIIVLAAASGIGRSPWFLSNLLMASREAGLHLTAHAGEWGGAKSVRDALDALRPARIGHGVQAIDDPESLHQDPTDCALADLGYPVEE